MKVLLGVWQNLVLMIVTYRVLLDDQIFTKWPMMCKLMVLKFEQFDLNLQNGLSFTHSISWRLPSASKAPESR